MQTLSDHILDIAQNSIRAQASRVEIKLQENITKDSLVITIRDNGCGMDETTVAKVTDPFSRVEPCVKSGWASLYSNRMQRQQEEP